MQAALKRNVISVEDYLAGEEASPAKRDYRKSNQWEPEDFKGLAQLIPLDSIALTLPLSAVYEGVPVSP